MPWHHYLLNIIVKDGFDSEAAILLIHSEDMNEIKKYVNDNKHILNSTAYSDFISDNENKECGICWLSRHWIEFDSILLFYIS